MGRHHWIIAVIFFLGTISYYSIFVASNAVDHFFGRDCAIELEGAACRDFFLFTIPSFRALAYSIAACSYTKHVQKNEPVLPAH
jgi:hypothetical protein